jgi:hypothetical protein
LQCQQRQHIVGTFDVRAVCTTPTANAYDIATV